MSTYHFIAASEAFLTVEEPLEEVLRERTRHYEEAGRAIDFWLVRRPAFLESGALAAVAHALMDASDGLARDLPRIARRSGVALAVDLDALPVHDPVRAVAERLGTAPGAFAATGGEDYELIAVLDPGQVAGCGVPLTVIGEVVDGPAEVRWRGAGSEAALRGWDHLAP